MKEFIKKREKIKKFSKKEKNNERIQQKKRKRMKEFIKKERKNERIHQKKRKK
jgi:hypothetical protein